MVSPLIHPLIHSSTHPSIQKLKTVLERLRNVVIFENMYQRKNKIRGFRKLFVWQDAQKLYSLSWETFQYFPFELKRVVSNQLASVDSIHRNIAEGYCRKTLNEYLQFLNYAKGSLGESLSGIIAFHSSGHLSDHQFEELDKLSFKLENGLIKLIESLEKKRIEGDWSDTFWVQESNLIYGMSSKSENDY